MQMLLDSAHTPWKPDTNHKPTSGRIAKRDLCVMHPRDLTHDREPESAAFHVLLSLASIKAFEYRVAFMRCDARTIIDNLQQRAFFYPCHADSDDGPVAGITDGVIDEIAA